MGKYDFDFSRKLEEMKKKEEASKSYGDSRFWRYKFDAKTKKGSAIIRFLPDRPSSDALPYVQYFSHWFQYHDGQNYQKYIDNCATTIGKECPICTKNRQLWKSPHESDVNVARKRKRKIHYISNILVIKDPNNPENEGKVFLWDYGPQIHSFLSRALYGPSPDDEDYIEDKDYSKEIWQPFNLMTGGDFYLRSTLKKNSDFLTYLPSEWSGKDSPIFPELDDNERDEQLDRLFSERDDNGPNVISKLDEWLDPNRFPSDSLVKKKLFSVLGIEYEEHDEEESDEIEDTDTEDTDTEDVEDSEESDDTEDVEDSEETSDDEYLESLLD